jgi:hypothetical protein
VNRNRYVPGPIQNGLHELHFSRRIIDNQNLGQNGRTPALGIHKKYCNCAAKLRQQERNLRTAPSYLLSAAWIESGELH